MFPVSDQFLAALRYGYTVEYRAHVWKGGVRTTPKEWAVAGLPIADGTVTVAASSQTRRTLDISIPDSTFTPETAQDLLAPYGSELAVEWGLRFPDGSIEWVPLGWFVIDTDSITRSSIDGVSALSMTGVDRFGWVIDDRFEGTVQTGQSNVVAEITALISQAMPAHVPALTDRTGSGMGCPNMVWDDHDRAGAVDELATSIGGVVFIDPGGAPILARVARPTDASVWTVDGGDQGVKIAEIPAVDRSNIYNAVVCTGESADGTAGGFGVARDTDPGSATQWGGQFGKKPAFFSSPVLTTNQACTGAAQSMLDRYTGAGWTLSLTSVVNPALDADDVITVQLVDGRIQKHIIDGFSIKLDPTAAMDITTRSNDPDPG